MATCRIDGATEAQVREWQSRIYTQAVWCQNLNLPILPSAKGSSGEPSGTWLSAKLGIEALLGFKTGKGPDVLVARQLPPGLARCVDLSHSLVSWEAGCASGTHGA